MKIIQDILDSKKIKKIQFYDFLCEHFNFNHSYPALVNWINGKKPVRSDYVWIVHRGINTMINGNIPITDMLFPAERVAELEAKFLRVLNT